MTDLKYIRDEDSKAIRNTDLEGLKAYKARKKAMQQKTNDINTMKNQISDLLKRVEILEKNNGNSTNN